MQDRHGELTYLETVAPHNARRCSIVAARNAPLINLHSPSLDWNKNDKSDKINYAGIMFHFFVFFFLLMLIKTGTMRARLQTLIVPRFLRFASQSGFNAFTPRSGLCRINWTSDLHWLMREFLLRFDLH